jgi:hypothetical protein
METFEIEINNIQVIGEITNRSRRDIAVRIVKPYEGISGGSHIPYFDSPKKNFEHELGDERAKQILLKIYEICLEIHEKKEELKAILPIYDSEKNKLLQEIDKLQGMRKELKEKMKKKLLSSVDYQRSITPLGKQISNCQSEIWRLFTKYFRKHFSNIISVGTDVEVIEFIRKL